jgi:hypothetical protein
MNEIKVTTELCAEDRARLDKTNELLATIIELELCKAIADKCINAKDVSEEPDELTKKLQEAVNSAQDATEENTPTTNPQIEEKHTEAENAKPEKVISRAELGAKVRELMTGGYKEQTKAIVKEYAPTVPGVPEDKVTECYNRLVALEGK